MGLNARALVLALLVGLVVLMIVGPTLYGRPADEIPYSTFLEDVRAGRISAARISGDVVVGTYGLTQEKKQTRVLDPDFLRTEMRNRGVQVDLAPAQGRPWWAGLLTGLLPAGLLIGYLWFMTRQSGANNQVFQFGRSRARLYGRGENRVTMKDVAGLPEAKEELQEVIDFLRHPDRYVQLGARIPKGVLLEGVPGTGKTLLAKAVAGEAGVPFYSISGSDFVELFAGVGAARVRDLFERAKQTPPCIIFIDEIDAVGRHRGIGLGGANDEREQTLNQMLVEMDGFGVNEGIIIMAATNRADVLDPALLRPGRFDRTIHIDPPDRQGREEILAVHARGKRLEADVRLDEIAGLTVGFTGADLANLLNEAALLTARRRKTGIGMAEVENAFERIITGGPERRRVISPTERERVAFHEAGHALVSRKLPNADPIQKVSIIPRGRAGGYVLFRPSEDKHMRSRAEILDYITGILAGRAAEEVVLGHVSNGAANDLERATDLARRMVTEWGMSPEVGPILVGAGGPTLPLFGMNTAGAGFSERTASAVDTAVRKLINEGYSRAVAVIRQHRDALERVARALLEQETLSASELDGLLA